MINYLFWAIFYLCSQMNLNQKPNQAKEQSQFIWSQVFEDAFKKLTNCHTWDLRLLRVTKELEQLYFNAKEKRYLVVARWPKLREDTLRLRENVLHCCWRYKTWPLSPWAKQNYSRHRSQTSRNDPSQKFQLRSQEVTTYDATTVKYHLNVLYKKELKCTLVIICPDLPCQTGEWKRRREITKSLQFMPKNKSWKILTT